MEDATCHGLRFVPGSAAAAPGRHVLFLLTRPLLKLAVELLVAERQAHLLVPCLRTGHPAELVAPRLEIAGGLWCPLGAFGVLAELADVDEPSIGECAVGAHQAVTVESADGRVRLAFNALPGYAFRRYYGSYGPTPIPQKTKPAPGLRLGS